MDLEMPPLAPVMRPLAGAVRAADPARATTSPAAPAARDRVDVVVDTFPSSPPADALADVQAAAARFDELRSRDRQLHFRQAEGSQRIVVEVHDGDGRVIRTIPPERAIAVSTGAELR